MSEENPKALLELKTGTVTLELRPDLAPKHVERITALINEGYYDGLKWHRVIDDFMAQTGCPEGSGYGGSGTKIEAEFSDEPFVRGTVGMARSQDPDSGDSQFFITFGDTSHLNNQYTVWAQVIDGMEHVDQIAKGQPPRDPDTIISFKIVS